MKCGITLVYKFRFKKIIENLEIKAFHRTKINNFKKNEKLVHIKNLY